MPCQPVLDAGYRISIGQSAGMARMLQPIREAKVCWAGDGRRPRYWASDAPGANIEAMTIAAYPGGYTLFVGGNSVSPKSGRPSAGEETRAQMARDFKFEITANERKNLGAFCDAIGEKRRDFFACRLIANGRFERQSRTRPMQVQMAVKFEFVLLYILSRRRSERASSGK
jgi:hypothetical protein